MRASPVVSGSTMRFHLDKQTFLDLAEILDAYRVFPRIYMGFFLFMVWDVHEWYKAEAGPYPEWYTTVLWGAVGYITGVYTKSGRAWTKRGNAYSPVEDRGGRQWLG